jgi:hypothetical protein
MKIEQRVEGDSSPEESLFEDIVLEPKSRSYSVLYKP